MLELLFYLFLLAMAILLPICLVVWVIYKFLKMFINPGSPMDRQIRSNELMDSAKNPPNYFGGIDHDYDDD